MFFVCLNIDFVRQVLTHHSSGILDTHPIFCFFSESHEIQSKKHHHQ